MPKAKELNERDAKLVEWLNEAYAKEAELEVDLAAHIRNAQEELREEHVEIALYLRIEAFAAAVGDRDTVALAKQIRRQEERMAKYLTAELPRLVRDVVKAEIPREQRATATRSRRRATSARSTTRSSRTTTRSARAKSPA